MQSVVTTNVLLAAIFCLMLGTIIFVTLYAVPVYIGIVHEANVEMAREYRAAEETHAQNWMMMVDRVFVIRGNSYKATGGD